MNVTFTDYDHSPRLSLRSKSQERLHITPWALYCDEKRLAVLKKNGMWWPDSLGSDLYGVLIKPSKGYQLVIRFEDEVGGSTEFVGGSVRLNHKRIDVDAQIDLARLDREGQCWITKIDDYAFDSIQIEQRLI